MPGAAANDDLMDLADRSHRAGRLAEAESVCRAILADRPDHVAALNLLGTIAGETGRYALAVDVLQRAVQHAPRNWLSLSNLAEAMRLQGRPAEAVPLLHESMTLAPPGTTPCHARLAAALVDLGRPEEALAACRAGLTRSPNEPGLNGLAAELLTGQGDYKSALTHLLIALEHAPAADRHWERLNALLRVVVLPPAEGRQWLLKALAHPVVHPQEIARSVARTLCRVPAIAELAALATAGRIPTGVALMDSLVPLGSDALLIALMETAVIPWPPLERLFTAVRRALLLEKTLDVPRAVLPFCVALATQAFLTDYAWLTDDEEAAALRRLSISVEGDVNEAVAGPSLYFSLTLLAMYRPLHELSVATRMAELPFAEPLPRLFRIQIDEPLQERALRAEIPRLTPIVDTVSREVRAQYEAHPYPRWIRAGRQPTPVTLPALLTRIGGDVPADPSFQAPDVLIAGCGTGRQALYAASFYRDARILAVDLSLASLAYALRKARESGRDIDLERITFAQGDILTLTGLGRSFHVIECLGVLHHLADPLAGWRVLVDLLRPGGLMYIALYSELARRAVVLGREHVASHGYAPTAADIRRCRRDILALPDEHPLAPLRRMRDLYNTSECRDLLFHMQEHRYTLPRIEAMLNELGLRFLGFNTVPRAERYRNSFPGDPRMTSLTNWHDFEQAHPDAFAGMYNFRAQKPA